MHREIPRNASLPPMFASKATTERSFEGPYLPIGAVTVHHLHGVQVIRRRDLNLEVDQETRTVIQLITLWRRLASYGYAGYNVIEVTNLGSVIDLESELGTAHLLVAIWTAIQMSRHRTPSSPCKPRFSNSRMRGVC